MSTSESPAFLVTLATGKQGGSVARELLSAGFRVNALVRDASKAEAKALEALGAVLFVGDMTNEDVIAKATAGVKGVFINTFPDFKNPQGEAEAAKRLVEAARAAGTVDTLVISTAFLTGDHKANLAADPAYEASPMNGYYASKLAAENAVRASGVKYWTVLRPPWLFHDYVPPYSTFHWPQLHTDRVFSTGIRPDLPIAHCDAEDVGHWAKAAFVDPAKFSGKEIKLSAEAYTLRDIVRMLEAFSGVEITTKFVEPSEIANNTEDRMAQMRALIATM